MPAHRCPSIAPLPLALLCLMLLPAGTGRATPPPIPTYDGCVTKRGLRTITGIKRVLDRHKQPLELAPLRGKRIRFKGYLLREPTLVMLSRRPTVQGACRKPPVLTRGELTLPLALKRARTPAGGPAGTANTTAPRVALVRAESAPLHSGELKGRQLLSNTVRLVRALSGSWPKQVQLRYSASVAANERALRKGERAWVVAAAHRRGDLLLGLALLPDTPAAHKRLQRALSSAATGSPASPASRAAGRR